MFKFLPEFREKIKWFDLPPDAGDPELPLFTFDADKDLEARFHIKCFGTVTGTEIYALPDEQEYYPDEELRHES